MSHSLTNTLETLVLQKDLFSFKLYESNCKTDSHSKVQGEDFCESFFLWIVWGIACCAKVASCLHIIQLKSSTLLQEQTFSIHNYVLVGSSISSLFWLVAQKDDLCAIDSLRLFCSKSQLVVKCSVAWDAFGSVIYDTISQISNYWKKNYSKGSKHGSNG